MLKRVLPRWVMDYHGLENGVVLLLRSWSTKSPEWRLVARQARGELSNLRFLIWCPGCQSLGRCQSLGTSSRAPHFPIYLFCCRRPANFWLSDDASRTWCTVFPLLLFALTLTKTWKGVQYVNLMPCEVAAGSLPGLPSVVLSRGSAAGPKMIGICWQNLLGFGKFGKVAWTLLRWLRKEAHVGPTQAEVSAGKGWNWALCALRGLPPSHHRDFLVVASVRAAVW